MAIMNSNKLYHFPTMNELIEVNDLFLENTLIMYLRNEIGKLTKNSEELIS